MKPKINVFRDMLSFFKTGLKNSAFMHKIFILKNGLSNEDRIYTALTNFEKQKLYALASIINGNALEIGSAFGASACFMAKGLKKNGNKLFCVDKWNIEYRVLGNKVLNLMYKEDGIIYEYAYNDATKEIEYNIFGKITRECPTFSEFKKNTKKYDARIEKLRGDSIEVSLNFDKQLDLLFIDGWHMYEGVVADCKAWLPKVKSGGIIIMHDYEWAEGVQKAVDEYVKPIAIKYEVFENMFIAWKR